MPFATGVDKSPEGRGSWYGVGLDVDVECGAGKRKLAAAVVSSGLRTPVDPSRRDEVG